MDSQLINPKSVKPLFYIIWGLIAISIFSCCSRADYNIICGFLILLLRSYDANNKRKHFSKLSLHILLIACIFDIIWIIKFASFWSHGEETSDLWKSLSFIHNSTYYLGIVEFLLKIPLIMYCYNLFKSFGGVTGELFSLKYKNTY